MWPQEPARGDKCGVLLTSARVSGLCQQFGLSKVLQAKSREPEEELQVLPATLPTAKAPKSIPQSKGWRRGTHQEGLGGQVPVFLAKEFSWCGHQKEADLPVL